MKNVKNGIKTTILGILLLILGFGYLFFSVHKEFSIDWRVFAGIGGTGIAFLFFPDDFIQRLKSVVKKTKINE